MMNQNQLPIPGPINTIILPQHSPQNFSLPSPIIHYIRKSPNPSLELHKICKYFGFKYQRVVVDHLRFSSLSSKWRVVDPDDINGSLYEIDPSTFKYYLWITESLEIYSFNGIEPKVASYLCKKILRCEISELKIEDQIISYKEFLLLTDSKKLKDVRIEKTIVKNSDGSLVHPEIVLARCSKVKEFLYVYPDNVDINPTTAKAFTKLYSFKNLRLFNFRNIPEGFDFEIFTKFIKKNPKVRCQLSFSENLTESYIAKLNKYVDNIIKSKATPLPHLCFPGQIKGTHETLWIMQDRFFP